MNLKCVHYVFVLVFFLSIPSFDFLYVQNFIDFTPFIKYVIDCKNLIMYNRVNVNNKYPYISECIFVNVMKDYIENKFIKYNYPIFSGFSNYNSK